MPQLSLAVVKSSDAPLSRDGVIEEGCPGGSRTGGIWEVRQESDVFEQLSRPRTVSGMMQAPT